MNDAYLQYQALDFAQDEAFIEWVNNQRNADKWQEWLTAHPEKKAVVEEARQLVQAIRVKEAAPEVQKIETIWANIEAATNMPEQATAVRQVWMRRLGYIAAAASVALFLLFYFFSPMAPERIHAERGEMIEHTLPDGSVVTLSAASEIVYTRSDWQNNRSLELEGEAFFEVTEGNDFTVKTNLGQVQVLGTSFNVKARENALQVDCFTGRVAVQVGESDPVILTPAEGASWNVATQNWQEYTADTTRTASWRRGTFYYDEKPLEMVYEEVERQFDVTIQAADSILQLPYTGFFERNNLDSALYQINWPMGLKSDIQNNKIEIRSLE